MKIHRKPFASKKRAASKLWSEFCENVQKLLNDMRDSLQEESLVSCKTRTSTLHIIHCIIYSISYTMRLIAKVAKVNVCKRTNPNPVITLNIEFAESFDWLEFIHLHSRSSTRRLSQLTLKSKVEVKLKVRLCFSDLLGDHIFHFMLKIPSR